MKWTIGRKLNGSFILIMLLAMGAITYIANSGLTTISNKAVEAYHDDTLPLVMLQDASDELTSMEMFISRMLLGNADKIDENIGSYKSSLASLFEKVTAYEKDGSIPSQPQTQEILKRAGGNIYADELKSESDALSFLNKSKDKLESSVNVFVSMVKTNQSAAAQVRYLNDINPQITQMKESLSTLSDLQLAQIKISSEAGIQMARSVFKQIASIIVISLLLGGLLFFILIKGIVVPLQNLLKAANAISQTGDLNQSIKVIHNDEAGELAKAFKGMTDYLNEMDKISAQIAEGNLTMEVKLRSDKDTLGLSFQQMTEYLREMARVSTKIAEGDLTQQIEPRSQNDVFGYSFKNMLLGLRKSVAKTLRIAENVSSSSQQLSSSAQQINSTTQEIAATVQQIAKGSQAQAQRVEEASKIIERMNMNVDQVASGSAASALTSVQASDDAKIGNQAVQAAMLKMNKIYETVINSAKIVKTLGERSEQIGEIVSVITNIADQTNLLALNAAIEAARAGEAGRGFAVVAEEVRKLAESSAKAAEEITVLIKGTQKEAEEAVKSMEFGSHEVQEGREIAVNAGNTLQEIIQTVQKTSSSIQLIAESAQQMAMSTKEVVKSIDDVAATAEQAASGAEQAGASTEQMSASMQEIAASSQELSEMALTLQESVAQFKLGDEAKVESHKFIKNKFLPDLRS